MSDQLQQLIDIESIKALKARYFRGMDTKDWATLASCFTEDLVADFTEAPGMLAEGRDNYVSQISEILKDATTIHHGHMPEIELIDAGTATGLWAMDDIVQLPDLLLQGWGHYHERYRKESGQWKISHIKLTRLRLLQNGEETKLSRVSVRV
ncbi:MAG: ketosteroid isomerase-like protein [Halioglobus sp.]|jgi:ketosteroid isomerase-like protein